MTWQRFLKIGVTAAVFIFLLKATVQYVPFGPYKSFVSGT